MSTKPVNAVDALRCIDNTKQTNETCATMKEKNRRALHSFNLGRIGEFLFCCMNEKEGKKTLRLRESRM